MLSGNLSNAVQCSAAQCSTLQCSCSCKPCHNPCLTSLASLAASLLIFSTPMVAPALLPLVLGGVDLHHVGGGAEELAVQLADRLGVLHRRLGVQGPAWGRVSQYSRRTVTHTWPWHCTALHYTPDRGTGRRQPDGVLGVQQAREHGVQEPEGGVGEEGGGQGAEPGSAGP